jgi:large subunit ribosomal protein L19
MNAIDWINEKYHAKKEFPRFKAGDSVKVHVKIKEGDKERIQIYEGVVIAIHRNGPSSTFTVRKISYGVGVERIFPFSSPSIEKVEVSSVGKIRRAKLYYLRKLSGKKARITALDRRELLRAEARKKAEAKIKVKAEAAAAAEETVVLEDKDTK